jgi:Protein of unknown function (DUF2612)
MQNVEATIGSQYANSPVLLQLIANMNAYIDPAANLTKFYNQVWNINTATGFGLDIWGQILVVSRLLLIPATGPFFGFDQSGSMVGFGQGVFLQYLGETTIFSLPDSTYRTLLLTKALANISSMSIPMLNQLVSNLFQGRGRCYCTDLGLMQMTYTFEFVLLPVELAILQQSGALPHPTGVAVSIIDLPISTGVFGFNGSGLQTFNNGTFFNPDQVIL